MRPSGYHVRLDHDQSHVAGQDFFTCLPIKCSGANVLWKLQFLRPGVEQIRVANQNHSVDMEIKFVIRRILDEKRDGSCHFEETVAKEF